ncbi:MAG: serine/threonine-protein kinase [Planctomycetota bacterium]
MNHADFPFLKAASREGEIGTVGRFGVRRLIGQGGMGFVFEAFDTSLERLVAVKVIKPELASSSENLQRFTREAKTLAAIRHRNVVTIFEVGFEGRYPFLAMELLSGETLAQRLWRAPVEPIEALRIMEEVCQGLDAAHREGVIHRDIKPTNLWIDPTDGSVRLLDFGLAFDRHLKSIKEDVIAGTLHYLAPEQASGDSVTSRTDLYAVGVTLYQLLARRLPHDEATSAQQLAAIVTRTPKPLHTITAALPQGLYQLLDRLLEKSPAKRPNSAAEVATELSSLRDGMLSGRKPRPDATVQVPEIDTVNAHRLSPKKRRFAITLCMGIAVSLIAVFAFRLNNRGSDASKSSVSRVSSEPRRLSPAAGAVTVDRIQDSGDAEIELSSIVVQPMLEPLPHANAIDNFQLDPKGRRREINIRNRPGRSREQSVPILRFEIDSALIHGNSCRAAELSIAPRFKSDAFRFPELRVLTASRGMRFEQFASMSWPDWLKLRQTLQIDVLGVIEESTISEDNSRITFSSPAMLRAIREIGRDPDRRQLIILLEQVERRNEKFAIHADPGHPESLPVLTLVVDDPASISEPNGRPRD